MSSHEVSLEGNRLVVGNWKMNPVSLNKNVEISTELSKKLKDKDLKNVKVGIVPMDIHINSVKDCLKSLNDSKIAIGGQNYYHKNEGAFTGQTSINALQSVGCTFALLAHSEQRSYLKLTNEEIKIRLKFHSDSNLAKFKVILCIGEKLEERDSGKTKDVLNEQLQGLIKILGENKDYSSRIIIAYEPVWAIGTGKNATTEEVKDAIDYIKGILPDKSIKVLYGGSVNSKNSEDLSKVKCVDGFLVGGASLKPEEFMTIINDAEKCFK